MPTHIKCAGDIALGDQPEAATRHHALQSRTEPRAPRANAASACARRCARVRMRECGDLGDVAKPHEHAEAFRRCRRRAHPSLRGLVVLRRIRVLWAERLWRASGGRVGASAQRAVAAVRRDRAAHAEGAAALQTAAKKSSTTKARAMHAQGRSTRGQRVPAARLSLRTAVRVCACTHGREPSVRSAAVETRAERDRAHARRDRAQCGEEGAAAQERVGVRTRCRSEGRRGAQANATMDEEGKELIPRHARAHEAESLADSVRRAPSPRLQSPRACP
eukprot:6205007-Pleurochrysis_carterae.AAC.1